jgi:hypothetical protein
MQTYLDVWTWILNAIASKLSGAETAIIFQNDHDLTISNPCVTLLPPDTLCQDQPNNDAGETTSTEEKFTVKYCVDCWRLVQSQVPLRSEAEMAYHMKGK